MIKRLNRQTSYPINSPTLFILAKAAPRFGWNHLFNKYLV